MSLIHSLKRRATQLKDEIVALYFAFRDRRTPWYAKVFIACVIGYAISPIDLIPDFIPILGYLDDLILIPFGVFVALKMIPTDVLNECRLKAQNEGRVDKRLRWIGIVLISAVWLLFFIWIAKSFHSNYFGR